MEICSAIISWNGLSISNTDIDQSRLGEWAGRMLSALIANASYVGPVTQCQVEFSTAQI